VGPGAELEQADLGLAALAVDDVLVLVLAEDVEEIEGRVDEGPRLEEDLLDVVQPGDLRLAGGG
jgi:hypothetical protein